MKVTPGQQQLLLKTHELSTELQRAKRTLAELESGAALRELQAEMRASSEVLLSAQQRYEEFEVDIARVLTDIELVDSRIERDLARLATSSNPKDIGGVQSELAALESRKSLLETSELEFLEARDAAGFEVAEAKKLRDELIEKIAAVEATIHVELGKLQSSVSIVESEIRATRSSLPEDLMAQFDRKASRGVPIGRLIDRACGTCHLSLTSAVYSDVMSSAEDELPTCPNCEAFIVR
jgi:predicted  nucleic acid-binding Zn-ribbon protein